MTISEKARKIGSFVRRKKKLFRACEYTCSLCGFSIKDKIEMIESMEVPTNKKDLKRFLNAKSILLSQIQTHHMIPLSEGGRNNGENLIILCEICHENLHKT